MRAFASSVCLTFCQSTERSNVLLQRVSHQAYEIRLTSRSGLGENQLEILASTAFLQSQGQRGLLDGAAVEKR